MTTSIVAYTFLDVCEKNSSVSVKHKKMHTKENWFFYSASGHSMYTQTDGEHDHNAYAAIY